VLDGASLHLVPSGEDRLPPDVNLDRAITVAGDPLNFRDRIGATPGSPEWWQHLDLDMSG
jgi:hypothetical protein